MTRCPDTTDWVLYAAGETPPDRLAALQAHLETCPACRDELAGLRRGLEALEALDPTPPLRAEALASLRDRLAAERKAVRPAVRPRRKVFRYGWVAAAAAAAATILITVLSTPHPNSQAWAESTDVENELVEIAAELELLESDTFDSTYAGAWELDAPTEPPVPAPSPTPPGQSRVDPPGLIIQNG